MTIRFDPDALLAALPRREITWPTMAQTSRSYPALSPAVALTLGEKGEYNGFSLRERNRTAALSNKLAATRCTARGAHCDICGQVAQDEHAENYYDLRTWVGMCIRCHRSALHKRFQQPDRWLRLLDQHAIPNDHWTRLVSMGPFDLAGLLRSRGFVEPTWSHLAPRRNDFSD